VSPPQVAPAQAPAHQAAQALRPVHHPVRVHQPALAQVQLETSELQTHMKTE
jgi:hypothetical protein